MSIETKTISISTISDEDIDNEIKNASKLGWELVSTSIIQRRGYRGTTITYKRDTEMPFYERKKQIGDNIDELKKIAQDYEKVIAEKNDKKDTAKNVRAICMLVDIAFLLMSICGIQENFWAGTICLVVSILLFALLIYLGVKSKKETLEQIEYKRTLEKIDNYYREAEGLGKENNNSVDKNSIPNKNDVDGEIENVKKNS